MSAVVRLIPKPEDEVGVDDASLLSSVVASAFSKRRKTLRNALSEHVSAAGLENLGIDPGLRPENIAAEDWVRLANNLATPKAHD